MLSSLGMTREAAGGFTERLTARLRESPRPCRGVGAIAGEMRELIAAGLADLPMPGRGSTWERWSALAAVAASDLSLAKIYEGHTDALAILDELHGTPSDGCWAVWAAEPPDGRVTLSHDRGTLTGRKRWCSGAAVVDHAVVSAWTGDGRPILAQVDMQQPGVRVDPGGWEAVGMAASQSVSVIFEAANARAVGDIDDYVTRPGFWQGGAGIAAVWYGGAAAVGRTLAISGRAARDPHVAAHLGAVDVSLRAARALLSETAAWIDAHPTASASAPANRVRACVEAAATEVLLRTGRALGAAPLCTDAVHAQRCADLTVFLRQSHAEHDLAGLADEAVRDHSQWLI